MNEWIACTHSMPEEDGQYLVYWNDGTMSFHPMNLEIPMSGWYEPLCGCEITHWMQITAPNDAVLFSTTKGARA